MQMCCIGSKTLWYSCFHTIHFIHIQIFNNYRRKCLKIPWIQHKKTRSVVVTSGRNKFWTIESNYERAKRLNLCLFSKFTLFVYTFLIVVESFQKYHEFSIKRRNPFDSTCKPLRHLSWFTGTARPDSWIHVGPIISVALITSDYEVVSHSLHLVLPSPTFSNS